MDLCNGPLSWSLKVHILLQLTIGFGCTEKKMSLHLIEKMGNYVPVVGGGETSGKRVAATSASRQENRAEKKRRREDGSEDDRGPVRTPRSESWKERGRGGGRQRGGNGPRGGQNMGRNSNSGGYGTQDASYNRQRDGYQNYGYSSRGPKGGGGGVDTAGGSTAAAWAAGTTHTESWILPNPIRVEQDLYSHFFYCTIEKKIVKNPRQ
jgi:hypothetical protein